MRGKNTVAIIIGIAVFMVLIVLIWIFSSSSQPETIEIGFIGALTGDAGAYGQTQLNSINLALNELNAKNKVKIDIIAEDGKCMGADAATATNKLVNVDGVKFIIGFTCSSELLSAAPISEPEKVILLSSFASNPQISDAGDYIFRNTPTDLDWAPYAVETIYSDGYTKMGILSENTEFAVGAKEIIKEKFIELGGSVVSDQLYSQDSKDYRTQITKIKDSNPEVIFLLPQSDTSAALAAKQIREMGITVPIYSTYVWTSPTAIETAGSASEGIYLFDAPGVDKINDKTKEFLDKYNENYGAPAHEFLAALSYDLPYILNSALEKCGEDTDCIRDFLSSVNNYNGVVGVYGFDEKGDVVGINFVKKQIINGEVETV